jgi:hypothetical protein
MSPEPAITQQPAPTSTMAVADTQRNQSVARLRGGCVPCPVSTSILQPTSDSCGPGWRILLRHTIAVLLLSGLNLGAGIA